MSDGTKTYVQGTKSDDDIRVTNDVDGSWLVGGDGDDILRGGRYNDILVGGKGNDQMFGGGGADQFRFFGYAIDGTSDMDRIYDLTFGDGDVLVFGSFGAGTFSKMAGVNGFSNGTSAIINSWEGVVNAATFSENVTAYRQSIYNNNLILSVTDADGQVQLINITGGWSQYVDAGGSAGL